MKTQFRFHDYGHFMTRTVEYHSHEWEILVEIGWVTMRVEEVIEPSPAWKHGVRKRRAIMLFQ